MVIDATGTYGNPNRLGDGGIPAPGERAFDGEIRRDIPDFAREAADWAGQTVLLAGAGHSAQTAVRDLAELARQAPGTRVIWALRSRSRTGGRPTAIRSPSAPVSPRRRPSSPAAPRRPSRSGAAWPSRRCRAAERQAAGRAAERRRHREVEVDRILSLTGFVGDHGLYRQLQVHECYATCGPIKLSAALLGAGGRRLPGPDLATASTP